MIRRACAGMFLMVALTLQASANEDTCVCSEPLQVDPSFGAVAAATGGTVERLGPDELGLVNPLADETFLGSDSRNPETGVEEGPAHLYKTEGPAGRHVVFVDVTLNRMVISFQCADDSGALSLYAPSDRLVLGNEDGATRVSARSGCRIHLERPEPGAWRLETSGKGTIELDVRGRTPLRFSSFERPSRRANVWGTESIQSVMEFELRSMAGDRIASLEATAVHDGYVLSRIPPAPAPRRLYALGQDREGNRFQRMLSASIEGTSVPPLDADPVALFRAELREDMKSGGTSRTLVLLEGLTDPQRADIAQDLMEDPDSKLRLMTAHVFLTGGYASELAYMAAEGTLRGDKALAAVGFTLMHSDDEELALRAMIEIHRRIVQRLTEMSVEEEARTLERMCGGQSPSCSREAFAEQLRTLESML